MDRAPHPCPHPECRALTTHLRGCPAHRPASKTAARGYDNAWRQFAARILRRRPPCVKCGAPAVVVDHKIPVRAGGARLDPRNAQPLCGRCHAIKTRAENADTRELNRIWR